MIDRWYWRIATAGRIVTVHRPCNEKAVYLPVADNVALFALRYVDRMNSAAQASADRYKPVNPELVKVLSPAGRQTRSGKFAAIDARLRRMGPFC